MKKLLILLLMHVGMAMIILKSTMAQGIVTFPDSNTYWHETYQWAPSPYYYNGVGTTYYTRDTIINQQVYHKLENIRMDVFCTDIVISGPNYVGGLREDTITRQAFYIYPNDTEEFLFFDFSLNSGDTIPPCFYTDFLQDSLVTGLDSIVTSDGVVRKRWFFMNDTSGSTSYVIEGIGNSFGLLNSIDVCFESCNRLICFEKDSSTLWINPWNSDCSIPTDTCVQTHVNLIEINSGLIVYPNPVIGNDILSLCMKIADTNLKCQYELLDMIGNSVSKGQIKSNLTQILTPKIKGVYVLLITNYYGISITKKIIVK